MDDINQNIQDLSDRLDQTEQDISTHADSIDALSATTDDLATKVPDDPSLIGQLDFPSSADTMQRIKDVFIYGNFVMPAGGSFVLSDMRIGVNSIVLWAVGILVGPTSSRAQFTLASGTVTWTTSQVGSDLSTYHYFIIP